MSDSDTSYAFGSGIGEDEVTRLEAQGAGSAQATRMIFTEAGIRPGMRVLDLGCGAGDVAFVAADLVGPGGSVVGLDHSPDALARAHYRAMRPEPDEPRVTAPDADHLPTGKPRWRATGSANSSADSQQSASSRVPVRTVLTEPSGQLSHGGG